MLPPFPPPPAALVELELLELLLLLPQAATTSAASTATAITPYLRFIFPLPPADSGCGTTLTQRSGRMRRMSEAMNDRKALVTGASRGIGAAVARAFTDAGARVALLSRSGDDLGLAGAVGISCDVA